MIALKDIFNGCWKIVKVKQGSNGRVRVDAVRRFHIPDENDFFSRWYSYVYANKVSRLYIGKDLEITEY